MYGFLAKNGLLAGIGAIGGLISVAFGGWTMGLTTLIICMAIDYLTGLMVAGVFKKSSKSDTGGLDSKAGWKGLCRKCVTLLMVLVACRLDMVLQTSYIRDAVVIAYVSNEILSIIENAGIMGVPIPKILKDAVDILKKKSEKDKEEAEKEENKEESEEKKDESDVDM